MIPVGKSALGAEFAFTVQLPISAHLCFEFLLEVTLRGYNCPRSDRLDLVSCVGIGLICFAIELDVTRVLH